MKTSVRFHQAIALALTTLLAGRVFAAEGAGELALGHHDTGRPPTSGPLQSPYAGAQDAKATGLLPEEVEALDKGAGMAMALPAELNGYPGPRHVLEAADAGQLLLRPEQREAVQHLFDRMAGEAKAKGQEVLAAEAQLATRFRHGHIDEASLREQLDRIGRLRAELRFIHLRTHLETKALLTPEQLARYNTVRGYDQSPSQGHQGLRH